MVTCNSIYCNLLFLVQHFEKYYVQYLLHTELLHLSIHGIPLRPKLIMMSASPSIMRLNVSGVTSLHTLKALKKASFITSSSRSGVYPRILQSEWKISLGQTIHTITCNQDSHGLVFKAKHVEQSRDLCSFS